MLFYLTGLSFTFRAQKKDFENVLNDLSVEQAELSTIPSVHSK